MDIVNVTLLYLILSPIICAVVMVKVCKGVRACYPLPEDRDAFERGKKAAFGFKAAAFFLFILLAAIVFFALVLMISGPRQSDQSGASLVLLCGGFLCSVGFIVSLLTSLLGYNYLFLAKSSHTAGLILAIPFFPIFSFIVLAFISDFFLGTLFLSIFSLHVISWILMRILLARRRKSFNASRTCW